MVCGDLVNAFPGQSAQAAQVADFKAITAALAEDIPLVCVCGNHGARAPCTPALATVALICGMCVGAVCRWPGVLRWAALGQRRGKHADSGEHRRLHAELR